MMSADLANVAGCPCPTQEEIRLKFQSVESSASVNMLARSPPGRLTLEDLAVHIGLAGQVYECALCMDELGPSKGVFCEGTGASSGFTSGQNQKHFYCFECICHAIKAECAGPTGRFQQMITADSHRQSLPGDLPCPMFPDECDCGRIALHQIYRAGTEDSEAADAYERASNRVAIIKADEEQLRIQEQALARIRDERARGVDNSSLDCLRRAVEIALDEGSTVRCPSCGTHAIKDGACMHMHCTSCRTQWCYCCGRRSGRGAGECERRHSGRGCDSRSCFLEHNPGYKNMAIAANRESPGDGAREEFHRRRMMYFLRLVMEQTTQEAWATFIEANPDMLADTPSRGRSIRWEDIPTATHPLFGQTTADQLPAPPVLSIPDSEYEVPTADAARQLVTEGDKLLLHKPQLGKESHNRFVWIKQGTAELCWGKQWQRENYVLWRETLTEKEHVSIIQQHGRFKTEKILSVMPTAPEVRVFSSVNTLKTC
eukprot:COSAG02_NODE_789_length_17189_cov_23.034114_14_plen_487_part_00